MTKTSPNIYNKAIWIKYSLIITYPNFIYAHGVEVPADYSGEIPEEFDVIDLEPCKLLVFQGEPYDDAAYQEAVGICMERIGKFNPEVYGYKYADEFAPMGWRGYIEMRTIKKML